MLEYQEWLKGFLVGKTEVPTLEFSDQFSVHSIRRFTASEGRVWEIAITYTGRLVLRSGQIEADGISIEWMQWMTQHDVLMPKKEGKD